MPKLTTLFDFNDRTSRKLKLLTGNFKSLRKTSEKPITISAVDRATKTVRFVDRNVNRLASKSYKVTVRGVDMASKTIGSVRSTLTSLPAMVTVALGVVGVDKLKDATVGAAMTFETYQVSMNHWLKGNKKAVKSSISWLDQFAAKTPMTMEDLFPAYTRGIGLSNGDLKSAQKLTRIATDMASLTPGKTVGDAMEALADAQMGEFERMKEFSMKMTQEEYKAIGGWAGFIKKTQSKFKGGAEALSKTSVGMISTIDDSTQTLFRSAGQGILESMKPRLQRVVSWIDNNQTKWNEWKDTLQTAGTQGAEWILSKLENAFGYISTNYLENDKFKKLDFEGKIKFIMGDIKAWWNGTGKPALNSWWDSTGQPWAEDIGLSMGKAIFSGIVAGAKEGIQSVGGMWQKAIKDPSMSSFGSAGIASAALLGVGSMALSPLLNLGRKTKDKGKWVRDKYSNYKNNKQPKQPQKKWPTTVSYGDQSKKIAMGQQKTVKSQSKLTKALGKFKLPSWGKSISKKIPFLGTALSGAEIVTAKGVKGKSKAVGSLAGGSAGTAIGGAIGSIIPGAGTVVGGLAGGLLGSWLGDKVGGWLGNKAISNNQSSNTPTSSVPNTNLQLDTSSLTALNVNIASAAKNMQILTMYSGMASGALASLIPVQTNASLIVSSLGMLTMYSGMASGALASLIPVQTNASLIVSSLGMLTMYSGMASGALASLIPVQTNASLIVSSLGMLTMYSGMASGWIATLYPIVGASGSVVSNLNILTSYAGMASGWIASISYIPSSASSVQTALNNLASRINAVQAPNVSGGSVGGKVKGFAKGTNGPLKKSQWAWVGEKGPELMRLNKGTEVFNNRESMSMANRTLPKEQVAAATSSSSNSSSGGFSGIRDVIVQIMGDSHYSNDIDAEKVGKVAVAAVRKSLEEEYFAGSEMAIYD